MAEPRNSQSVIGKAAKTRQRIVEAAAAELAAKGYGGTSIRQVAVGANLKSGSLYFHFQTKDELVAETLREGVDYAINRVEKALAQSEESDPIERIRVAILANLSALHASHDRATAVVRMADTLPPDLRIAQAAHERRYGQLWLTLLVAAQDSHEIDASLDARTLRDIVIASMNSTINSTHVDGHDYGGLVSTLLALLSPGR